jgi:catechol 2,3-dioxygenase-like lactoylglutathione lyase family enzyme
MRAAATTGSTIEVRDHVPDPTPGPGPCTYHRVRHLRCRRSQAKDTRVTPAAAVRGLHHLKTPISDRAGSLRWYRDVFGAEHLQQFDHFDDDGARYAAIVAVAGLPPTLELRWAPKAAAAIRECDTITLAVGSVDELQAWAAHLDSAHVEHSPVTNGAAGHLLIIDPDGIFIRMADVPAGGVTEITMPKGNPEPDGPWLNPPAMQHPRT